MAYKLLLLTRENAEYRQLLSEKSLPGLTILGDDPANIASADIWLAEPALAQPLLSHGKISVGCNQPSPVSINCLALKPGKTTY